MNITKSHIEWSLTYEGEVMVSPLFRSYEECVEYINNPQNPHSPDKYEIVSRIVVTTTSSWAVWK